MYPVGIVGDEGNAVRDELASALADHGRVATVDRAREVASATERGVSYRLGPDGGWTATGEGVDLTGVLDRLAPTHEYAVVTGYPEADVPQVVVGAADYEGDPLLRVDDPGTLDPGEVRTALKATTPYETLASLIEGVKGSPEEDRAGAIATFTGRVRERDGPEDDPTQYLEFETYDGVARDRMDALESELESREGVLAVRMHHRTGVIESGEDIVFVVVLAGHRGEAFETVSDGIDRLKAEVPIFKKEVTTAEEYWRHER